MEKIKGIVPLFTAGIFFVALTSLVIVTMSVGFVWANSNFTAIKADIAKLETGQVKLETGQAKLEKRMDGIEVKLDILLELIKKK